MNNNPFFENMYQHYMYGVKNFNSFSRVQKLDYAYTTLVCVRDFYCNQHKIDPKNIEVCFARMPGSNGRSTWKKVENNVVKETRVALEITEALRGNTTVERLFSLVSHEMGHSVDALTRKDFTAEHNMLYKLGINTFSGPGWWGRKDERIADEFAKNNMLSIFDRQISEDPSNESLISQREKFAEEYRKRAENHAQGEKELAELVKQAKKEKSNILKPRVKSKQESSLKQDEDRMVIPAIRNTKAFVDRIVEEERISSNPQGHPQDPLFIYPNTIKQVAEESKYSQIANNENYIVAEGQELVSLNSSPFEDEKANLVDDKMNVTKEVTADNFDTKNMSEDALRDLNEVIKIQSPTTSATQNIPQEQLIVTDE